MFLISKDYIDIYPGFPAVIPKLALTLTKFLCGWILLPSNSEHINSEEEAQGSYHIQVKGHRKLQDNI